MSHFYPVPADFGAQANISAEEYESMYAQKVTVLSVESVGAFGLSKAQTLRRQAPTSLEYSQIGTWPLVSE